MTTPVVPGRGKYQHADAPKPRDGETNAFVEMRVAIPGATNEDGTQRTRVELRPVPETWPGGFYKNALGQLVDARGVALTVDPTATMPSSDELVAELAKLTAHSPDDMHPAVQQMIARERAREREAAHGISRDVDDKRPTPPERPEDLEARKRFGKTPRPMDT